MLSSFTKTETVYTKTNKPITKCRTTKAKTQTLLMEINVYMSKNVIIIYKKLKRYIQKQINQSQNVERQKQKHKHC